MPAYANIGAVIAVLLAIGAGQACAQVKLGAVLSVTGPASFLGDPEKKTLEMYIDEINVTELVALRDQLREPLAERGVKLTYLSFFVLAAAKAIYEKLGLGSEIIRPRKTWRSVEENST